MLLRLIVAGQRHVHPFCRCPCAMSSAIPSQTQPARSQGRPHAKPPRNANALEHTDISLIRNIGIMAHIDAGKTTTTERMLYYSGFTRRLGDVDDGDTVTDYMDQERERGITITSAAISFTWGKHLINLIDTPGHVDFTLEVERSLRVLDGAVAVLDASAGVEAQTITVWRQADRYNVPRIAYMNKMDKLGANFIMAVNSLKEKLRVTPLILQLPVGCECSFSGILDVLSLQKITWDPRDPTGRTSKTHKLTVDDEHYNECMDARTKLVEQLADLDDEVAGYVLEDEPVPMDVLQAAVRCITLAQTAIPVLCGSSYKNKGVQPLMDAIIDYLPSPSDRQHDFVGFYAGELCALAFKTVYDKQRGALTFVRVYSGELGVRSSLYNVTRKVTEKVSRLLRVSADDYQELAAIRAGNIAAITGLKQAFTGDTLTASAAIANKASLAYHRQHHLTDDEDSIPVLAALDIPEPVFFCSIELHSNSHQNALDIALKCLTREDPSLKVRVDEDTGQTILEGMGELHLDIIQDRIRNDYGVPADLGPLQIAYRETPSSPSEVTTVLDKMIREKRHCVTVSLSLQPEPGMGMPSDVNVKPNKDSDLASSVNKYHRKAVNSGVSSALSRGLILGFQVIDVQVSLHELQVVPGTSLPMVTACAAQAVTEALQAAKSTLLEPTMDVVVYTDDVYLGTIMSDLTQRRSQIVDVKSHHATRTLVVITPLSQLRGYSTWLRTKTSGTASFFMQLASYQHMTLHDQRNAILEVTGFLPKE